MKNIENDFSTHLYALAVGCALIVASFWAQGAHAGSWNFDQGISDQKWSGFQETLSNYVGPSKPCNAEKLAEHVKESVNLYSLVERFVGNDEEIKQSRVEYMKKVEVRVADTKTYSDLERKCLGKALVLLVNDDTKAALTPVTLGIIKASCGLEVSLEPTVVKKD